MPPKRKKRTRKASGEPKGNPVVFLRLDPGLLERLREKAREAGYDVDGRHAGKAGGLSEYLRRALRDHANG